MYFYVNFQSVTLTCNIFVGIPSHIYKFRKPVEESFTDSKFLEMLITRCSICSIKCIKPYLDMSYSLEVKNNLIFFWKIYSTEQMLEYRVIHKRSLLKRCEETYLALTTLSTILQFYCKITFTWKVIIKL